LHPLGLLAQALDIDQLLYRWVHLIAGVLWLSMLYSFTLVHNHAVAALDAPTRARVLPEYVSRSLFWFRWAALLTWVSGVALLIKLYYARGSAPIVYASSSEFAGQNMPPAQWLTAFGVLLLLLGVYELIARGAGRQAELGYLAWAAVALGYGCFLEASLHMSQRAIFIHVGALLGSSMAYNAWVHIGPCFERLIAAARAGEPPAQADVERAAARSRHNLYQSTPLLLFMVAVHQERLLGFENGQLAVAVILFLGLAIGWGLRQASARIPS